MKIRIHTALLIIAMVTIAIFSCRKPKPYTISGRIYESCGVPANNKTFSFYQSGGGGGTLGTATTDANGKFSLTYEDLNSTFIKVGVPLNIGYSEYGWIEHSGFANVTLYGRPSTYLSVSMQVYNNTYTNNDTLYIADYRRTSPPYQIAIPGPFTPKVLYSVPNYSILNYIYPNTLTTWGYKINSRDYIYKIDTLKACDTTMFIVDIR